MIKNVSKIGSVNSILDDFISDIFESVTFVIQPVIGGFDSIKRTHKQYLIRREIEEITNLSSENREKFLDSLTDIVSVDIYNMGPEGLKKRIESIELGSEALKETFEKLESFTNKLDNYERAYIVKHSLTRLNGKISSIRESIKSRIWDKKEDSSQLLILDQILFLIQELVKMLKNKDNPELWMRIVVSLLRIEAFHRGKIPFNELDNDISELSTKIQYEKLSKNHETVFTLLE